MSYVLHRTRTRTPQYNSTRRGGAKPSGVIVVHTAENNTDFTGPDTGAEAVLSWITQRPDYGSYHRLVDSDSTLKMVPWSAETFHCTLTNRHSVGISAAIRSADWNRLGDRGLRIVDRMAIEAADFIRWIKRAHGVTVPVRMISRNQAANRTPGFIAHGTTDPGRRTDPGRDFPWTYFLDRVRHHLGTGGSTPDADPPEPSADVARMLAELDYAGVRTAQKDLGLVIDGVAGPITTRALEAEMTKLDDIKDLVEKNNHEFGRIAKLLKGYHLGEPLAAMSDVQVQQAVERGSQHRAALARIDKSTQNTEAVARRIDPGKEA